MGYVPDLVQAVIAPHARELKQRGMRVIANSGGVNPHECAKAVLKAAASAGLAKGELRVAVVDGDDLLPRVNELRTGGFTDIDSRSPFPEQTITSMNAYFGCAALPSPSPISPVGFDSIRFDAFIV